MGSETDGDDDESEDKQGVGRWLLDGLRALYEFPRHCVSAVNARKHSIQRRHRGTHVKQRGHCTGSPRGSTALLSAKKPSLQQKL